MRILYFIIGIFGCNLLHSTEYEWNVRDANHNKVKFSNDYISAFDTLNYVVARTEYDPPFLRTILTTSDYGNSWDTLYKKTFPELSTLDLPNITFLDIAYVDQNNIVALYGHTHILRTSDRGKTWIDTNYFNDKIGFNSISSVGNILFLAGNSNTLARSTDFGETWELKQIKCDVDSVEKYERTRIMAPIAKNDILYTNVYFYDKLNFLSDINYDIHNMYIRSYDFGETWEDVYFNDDFVANVDFDVKGNELVTQSINYTFKKVAVGDGTDTAYISQPTMKIIQLNMENGQVRVLADSSSVEQISISSLNWFDNTIFVAMKSLSYLYDELNKIWITEKRLSPVNQNIIFTDYARVNSSKGLATGMGFIGTLEVATSVDEAFSNNDLLLMYPNPISKSNKLHIEFEVEIQGEYSFSLTSADGAKFDFNQKYFAVPGNNTISLDIPNEVAAGAYFLSITKDGEILAVKQLVVQ